MNESSNCTYILPENCADSPLWHCAIRKLVKDSKVSNAHIDDLRKTLLVPGSNLEEKGTSIPIMLIQRPGKQSQEHNGKKTIFLFLLILNKNFVLVLFYDYNIKFHIS
ncbi:hypothetical protein NQ314_003783 [Rhamnusium bicolor]|uniref:Uncharacterized protein n=1 Tax=Rhamnusium bicolor TaxID=1586634 RepID=A0AAV8ZL43_9CUCU|nr:hypothetical protein NQ314_003783 [Rhamnusium bicolor]